MKIFLIPAGIALLAIAVSQAFAGVTDQLAAPIGEPMRGVGNWAEDIGTHKPHTLGDGTTIQSMGNHRARIIVSNNADAVCVRILWRRRDANPQEKAVLVVDAKTGMEIANVVSIEVNREFGDIVFQPTSGPGEYYVYYMPYSYLFYEGSGDYRVNYTQPQETAAAAWVQQNGLSSDQMASGKWRELPRAEVPEIQARTEFDRFDPMEVIATQDEMKALLAGNQGRSYLLFPEDRRYPIRMKHDLPLKWMQSGPSVEFKGEACRNEFYPFQIGLYASSKRLFRIGVEFSDLRSSKGHVIPASALRCFNAGGIDAQGKPFTRTLSVPQGEVLSLWIGVDIPKSVKSGTYEGTVTIKPANAEETKVNVALTITNEVLEDRGDGELWRHSRLRWLDSTIGIDDGVTPPYTPVKAQGSKVSVLQRDIRFSKTGLPDSIRSKGLEILARPMALIADTASGPVAWRGGEAKVVKSVPASAVVETDSSGAGLALKCVSTTEYDGCISFDITLKALEAINLKGLRLEIPFRPEFTTYLMGLGDRGGLRPKGELKDLSGKVWLGGVDAGLQCTFNNRLWSRRTITEAANEVLLRAESGEMSLKPGEERKLSFQLLVTPLKPLDQGHWDWRYHQAWKYVMPIEKAKSDGVKIMSVHQGCDLNPYINYPFLTPKEMAAYSNNAHANGMKAKYYYTLRELSNYAVELWAFRSVEPNMFPNRDQRGGNSWLLEHVAEDYEHAWHSWASGTDITDAAMVTSGGSRLMNYYLEGLSWLVKNVGDDGLYVDGLAYGSDGMRRVRKALDRAKPGCLIDFHSGRWCTIANSYMQHFPYMDSIWFGEGFDYGEQPDYWLVEVAGIPFGLYGEMLGEGSPWRGMLYGMTNRLGWGGDPRAIWKVWDDFGIKDSKMIGYWEPDCPVKTGREDVLATVYVKKDKTLISIASWAKEPVNCRLTIDWAKLGLSPSNLHAAAVKGFQEEKTFAATDEIPVPKGKGWMLVVGK